jgi:hypothetical protein
MYKVSKIQTVKTALNALISSRSQAGINVDQFDI